MWKGAISAREHKEVIGIPIIRNRNRHFLGVKLSIQNRSKSVENYPWSWETALLDTTWKYEPDAYVGSRALREPGENSDGEIFPTMPFWVLKYERSNILIGIPIMTLNWTPHLIEIEGDFMA